MSPLAIRRVGVGWAVYRTDVFAPRYIAVFRTLAEAERYVMEHGAPHKAKT